MSLRLKIALGLFLTSLTTACVLMFLVIFMVDKASQELEEQHIQNQDRIQKSTLRWQKERERSFLATAKTWVNTNLAGVDDITLIRRLRENKVFQRWSILTPQGLKSSPPEVWASSGPQDKLLSKDYDFLRKALSEKTQIIRSNQVYFPYFRAEGISALLYLEITAEHIEVPQLQAPNFDLQPIVNVTAWTLALGFFFLLSVLFFMVRGVILKPLSELLKGSQRVAQGDLSSLLKEPRSKDEIAQLVRTFNSMQTELLKYQTQMEKRISKATRHISQQNRSLAIAQRLAATGTLVASLAHEINNPLGGMLNALERLKKQAQTQRDQEYFEIIFEGLERIRSLMSQVLSFSRRRETEPKTFKLTKVVEQSLKLIEYRFKEPFQLRSTIDPGLPEVFGDDAALGQVIVNLLLNARDALEPKGEGLVEIRLSMAPSQHQQSNQIKLEIIDQGVGMDEETRSKIFTPFFSTKEKGTGLGLAIVQTIIQDHEGRVEVSSELGKGSCFSIFLPCADENT